MVRGECMATVGAVSNPDHMNADDRQGRPHRWKGKRPHVRGVAMNPIDHPHGGGEGRTSGGRHPVTPWGKPTKGYKTRNNKRDGQVHHAPPPRRRRRGSDDPFRLEGSVRRRLSAEEGGEHAGLGPQRGDQDLVAPLDHHAAVRRPDLRRPQRQEVHPGAGQREHGGPEVRRVLAHPHFHGHSGDKKAKRASHGQTSLSAQLDDDEALAMARNLRVSPRKLNLVAAADPRQAAAAALAELEFSRSGSRTTCARRCSRLSPTPRTTTSSTSTACMSPRRRGQGAGDEAFQRARPRPRARIEKPFSHLRHRVVRERAEAE